MLLAIRERIMGFLGWVILGILFVAFAFFGLNSYLQDDVSSFAAVVNGQEISAAQHQQAYDQLRRKMEQQLGESFDPAMLDENMLKASALQQLINQTLLIQAADSEGFAASNEQIALSINAVDAFKEDGVFSKDRYEQVLGYQGIRPAGFENSLKEDIIAGQFTVGVSATAAAPDDNLAQAYVLEGQQRRFKYLLLPLSGFTEQVSVSDEDIQSYYDTHADAFMTPQRVRAQYLELDVATLDTGVEVSDEALQLLYEEQAAKYVTPEERHARHILVRLAPDADEEADTAAMEKANDIVARLDNGEDFAVLAKELSDDPGSAANGGDLGTFGRGLMTPEFEKAAFELQSGEVSKPVKSPFGLHIIEVIEITPEVVTPLDEVREELADQLLSTERADLFYEKSEVLSNTAFEQPDTLQGAAEELGIAIQETDWVSMSDGSGVAQHANVREALFSEDVLDNGNNSAAIEIGPDHVVVIRVLERQESAQKPIETVKEQIRQITVAEKSRAQAQAKGEQYLADLRSSVTDLDTIATAESLQVQETESITRVAAEPGAEVIAAAFAAAAPVADKPVHEGVLTAAGDYVIIALEEVKAGDFSSLPPVAQKQLWGNLNRLLGVAELAAVMSTLKAQASIEIPDQAE
ncbi:MAG: SurA N-terminal domain-containing protein [Gammaproteobacteria bacterium]|nr:SurA N-terminal domain-containing protein [Gammaproteobacteria bacterium]MDH3887835.1 SurA N-terminal domain-containing protein [Gammaproteobacteria bacterium]MDH3934115.1 SurA N-terminal domain-containing protein [Gammaproteobacteria bacterium]MDH3985047.1 SurA N-terminal domain-containing protein [Gammaproteobacteria bacterium]